MSIFTHRATQIARRVAGGAIVALTLAVTACGGSSTASVPPPASTKIISDADTKFGADTTLHFNYTADKIAPGLYSVIKADGDVVRPGKIQLKGLDQPVKGVTACIALTIVDQGQYLDLGCFKNYTKTSAFGNLLLLFDPAQGIGAVLTKLQNPTPATSDTINNIDCWKLSGGTDSSVLAPLTGSTATTPTPIQATLWIGKADSQVYQVQLTGIAIDGDTAQSVRTFVLSNFNAPVTITAPVPAGS